MTLTYSVAIMSVTSRSDAASVDHELTNLADDSSEDEHQSVGFEDADTETDADSLIADLEHFKKMHNPVAATILEKSQSEEEYRLTVTDHR